MSCTKAPSTPLSVRDFWALRISRAPPAGVDCAICGSYRECFFHLITCRVFLLDNTHNPNTLVGQISMCPGCYEPERRYMPVCFPGLSGSSPGERQLSRSISGRGFSNICGLVNSNRSRISRQGISFAQSEWRAQPPPQAVRVNQIKRGRPWPV